ncbi:LysR family transcriptional regulator [Frondihabitans australicus]|uniref:DNA-binding transcriptional LysR family regulator n=1 Tax=Frondihabitans australicus TaxID=386892 RepID=A0A495IL66_9MICO|nr:LysR family transcriptional regulator [Frondihabitans australicus]RKR75875.1 DNA-binding transcriptional LysR family regulator [Frondihabitans australicus]
MEVRHLRYFLALAEEGNFTRAARSSRIAQSALSQQIARLEREVGADLFVRGPGRVTLTPAGDVLLPHAGRVVADVDAAQTALREYHGLERGHLRIGLIQTASSAFDVTETIARFHHEHPRIDVQVHNASSTKMLDELKAQRIDLAIVALGPGDVPKDLSAEVIAVDPLVAVVASSRLPVHGDAISVGHALELGPLIGFAAGTGVRRHVDAAIARSGSRAQVVFELSQATDILAFAAAGLGVAMLPETLARAAENPDLLVLPLTDCEAVHFVTLVDDPRRRSTAGNAFRALLQAHKQTDDRGHKIVLDVLTGC